MKKKANTNKKGSKQTSKKQSGSKTGRKVKSTSRKGSSLFKADSKKTFWLFLSLLFILTMAAMGPVIQNEFINFDDAKLIYENTIVTQSPPASLQDIFSKLLFTPYYKPLVFLTWIYEYQISGPNPHIFHINNLILHLLNTFLVFFIFIRLLKSLNFEKTYITEISFFIAALFAVHPLHVESVAWAVERKDVLYGFFFLGSIFAYVQSWESKKRLPLILLSSFLFLCSLLSKSPAIVLPVILVSLEWLRTKKLELATFKHIIPHVILILFSFYFYGLFGNFSLYASGLVSTSEGANLTTGSGGSGSILRKMNLVNSRLWLFFVHLFFPAKLSLIYPRAQIVQGLGSLIYLFPLLSLGVFIALYKFRNKWPIIITGFIFFLVTMLPVLAMSGSGTNYLSDRYTYISSIGIFLAAVCYLYRIYPNFQIAQKIRPRYILIFAILVFTYLSHSRSKLWNNSGSLWSDTIEKFPGMIWDAYNGRGLYNKNTGNFESALADFNTATNIKFDHRVLINRAAVFSELGNDAAALKDLNEAMKTDQHQRISVTARGNLYFKQRKYQLALADYNKVIEMSPEYTSAHVNRAVIFAEFGQHDKALAGFAEAQRIDPYFAETYNNRSLYYQKRAQYDKSTEDCNTLLKISPGFHAAYNTRGINYYVQKKYDLAVSDFSNAIALDPQNGSYYFNRAKTYDILKKYSLALRDLKSAQSYQYPIDPTYMHDIGKRAR